MNFDYPHGFTQMVFLWYYPDQGMGPNSEDHRKSKTFLSMHYLLYVNYNIDQEVPGESLKLSS
jgi:hypothetical protein